MGLEAKNKGFLAGATNRRDLLGLLLAGALGGIAAYPAKAKAAIDPAENYVTGIAGEVMRLANSGATGNPLRAKFSALLNRYINLRQIANYALGSYLAKLPAGKKDEFYRLVGNYAAALFVYYVEDFRGNELEINSNTKQGQYTIIMSAIKLKGGGREQIRWRLTSGGSGYHVADVNLKGVWLTISMKDRFNKVLNRSKGDFDALFDELRQADTW